MYLKTNFFFLDFKSANSDINFLTSILLPTNVQYIISPEKARYTRGPLHIAVSVSAPDGAII